MNSGGASSHTPPSLAARGFTIRRKKIQAAGGSGAASSPLPFHAGGEGHRDLQQQKTHTTVDFTLF